MIKYLRRVLPRSGMDPAAVAVLLGEPRPTAPCAPSSNPVGSPGSPGTSRCPAQLRRADRRSVDQRLRRHPGTPPARSWRWKTARLPKTRERARRAYPRASSTRPRRRPARARLRADPPCARRHAPRTQIGPREDQAAAGAVGPDRRHACLGDQRAGRVRQTHVRPQLGCAGPRPGWARWSGVTAAQSARNTRAAGSQVFDNAAEFLGHLPGRRGARARSAPASGRCCWSIEASTMPGRTWPTCRLRPRPARMRILAGEPASRRWSRTVAACPGPPMALGFALARRAGRFRAAWTVGQPAAARRSRPRCRSTRPARPHPRRATPSRSSWMIVVVVYIASPPTAPHSGRWPPSMRRAAGRAAASPRGSDRLGIVEPGPVVPYRRRRHASRGDLITATRNDDTRRLYNLRGRWPTGTCCASRPPPGAGLVVRRALDADPATGHRRWTDRNFLTNIPATPNRARGHRPRGRGPHGAHRPGGDHRTQDRQHAYVALSRDHAHLATIQHLP